MNTQKRNGITLITLVITIVVLLILVVVSINMLIGDNGILNKVKEAKEENNKQSATEIINLKITNTQMKIYAKENRMPILQEIADDFCQDNEIQYVTLESKKTGNMDKIIVGEAVSIFTKLKEYPYEFEINNSLQLASINGVKIANNDNYNDLKSEITQLKKEITTLSTQVTLLKNNKMNKTQLIKRDYSASNIKTKANQWTNLESRTLSGYGSGIAIICYTAKELEIGDSFFETALFVDNQLVGDSTDAFEADFEIAKSGCVTSSIHYEEGTIIDFKVWSSKDDVTTHYNYSILLIPD